MAEVVETRLTADASDLRREFAKAAESVDALESKIKRTTALSVAQFSKLPPAMRKQQIEFARLARAQDKFNRQGRTAGKTANNLGLGFLEVSRAVEDAQYGFRGVLNNIPQIITLFGGPAGMAAAISIAAVAAATLGPALLKTDSAARKAAKGIRETVEAARELKKIESELARIREGERSAAFRGVSRGRDESRQSLEALDTFAGRDSDAPLEDQLANERDRLARAEESSGRLLRAKQLEAQGTREFAEALAEQNEELKREAELTQDRLIEEVGGTKKAKGLKGLKDFGSAEEFADYVKQNRSTFAAKSKFADRGQFENVIAIREAQKGLEQEIAANEARLEAELEAGAEVAGDYAAGLEAFNKEITKSFQAVKQLEKDIKERGAKRAQGSADENTSIAALQAELGGDEDEAVRLRATIKVREDGLKLAKELGITEAEGVEIAQKKHDLEVAIKKEKAAQAKAEKDKKAAERDAKDRLEQNEKRDVFGAELKALELEARGRGDIAERIRTGLQLREDGLQISRELGVTEEKGMKLAARKHRIEQAITEEKEKQKRLEEEANAPDDGRIRLFDAAESLKRRRARQREGGGRVGGALDRAGRIEAAGGRKIGFRNRAQEKRDAERAAAAEKAKADARDPEQVLKDAAADIKASRAALEKLVGGKV